MFWLYLLATVTLLTIALRRLKLRQDPLADEVYSRAVAFEHVQSGIAWVKNDGMVGSINASLAATLAIEPKDALGMHWCDLFAKQEKQRIEQAYSQMLLVGKSRLDVGGRRSLDDVPGLDLLMVAVHDHKMRFIGHHCLVADRSRERLLETQVRELRAAIDRLSLERATSERITPEESVSRTSVQDRQASAAK